MAPSLITKLMHSTTPTSVGKIALHGYGVFITWCSASYVLGSRI